MVGDVIIYELRVMSYELEIFYASWELLFASWKWKLQVANLFYELQVTIHESWVTFYELKIKISSCKLWLYFTLRRNLQNTERIAKVYCLFN